MPARTPSKRNPGGGGGRSNHHLVDDDLPIYGIQASPSNPISTIGPNGGFRPGSGIVPGSAGRKSSETANHNLNHLLGLRMPPRMVVGSGIGSSMSYGSSGMSGSSGAAPRRSRGIRSSFNKDKYVNAQFRFVMKPSGNYTAHFADPDLIFPFQQILQVIVPTTSLLSLAQGQAISSNLPQEEAKKLQERKEQEEEAFKCPICLGKPVAGRMTKCGHIFCFPCIIHYFTLSDVPRSAKCPICGETIQEFLLKSVRWWDEESVGSSSDAGLVSDIAEPSDEHLDEGIFATSELEGLEEQPKPSGNRIRMRLVQRPQITTLALPRSPTWPSAEVPINEAPWHFIPNVLSFSKFMLATSTYMISQLEREMEELREEKQNLRGDELGTSFVDVAMTKVKEQMEKARVELDTPVFRRMERDAKEGIADVQERWKRKKKEADDREERERVRRAKEEADKEKAEVEIVDITAQGMAELSLGGIPDPTSLTGSTPGLSADAPSFVMGGNKVASFTSEPHRPSRPKRSAAPQSYYFTADDPSYFYYQAENGLNVYLSPLDIKILLAHYKSYTAFPDYINVKPEGADEGSMNEDLRKRCKYLAHLQIGTNVVFVEADLEETLGKDAVAAFEAPLKRRRDRKRDKAKKEDRAKVRWEAQERERLPFGAQFNPGPPPPQTATKMGSLDEDFLLALERSTADGLAVSPATSHAIASTMAQGNASDGLSPSGISTTSSSGAVATPRTNGGTTTWGSPPGGNMSFASAALHGPGSSRGLPMRRRDPEIDDEMSRAWSQFEESAAAARAIQAVEGEEGVAGVSPSSKQGGKKGRKKVVLSMGGGGRRG